MILGVTGYFAAGKDTCAAFLEEQGYHHVSLSQLLRDELQRRGEEINLPNLTAVGNELRNQHGHGVLARLALEKLEQQQYAVVTSIRHPDEVKTLREGCATFAMIFVDAPQEVRFARSQDRSREGDFPTLEEFAAAEQSQRDGQGPATQQLDACRKMADRVLHNGSTREAFLQQIREALTDFTNRFSAL